TIRAPPHPRATARSDPAPPLSGRPSKKSASASSRRSSAPAGTAPKPRKPSACPAAPPTAGSRSTASSAAGGPRRSVHRGRAGRLAGGLAVLGARVAPLDGRLDEAREQRVGLDRAALELGVELAADVVRVVGQLDHLHQPLVR